MRKSKTLRVTNDLAEELLRIRWETGDVFLEYASDSMRDSADEWIRFGLSELIGTGEAQHYRYTSAESSVFVDRLADYIQGQFGFSTKLVERDLGVMAIGSACNSTRGTASQLVAAAGLLCVGSFVYDHATSVVVNDGGLFDSDVGAQVTPAPAAAPSAVVVTPS